jgi:hypothetical protein
MDGILALEKGRGIEKQLCHLSHSENFSSIPSRRLLN